MEKEKIYFYTSLASDVHLSVKLPKQLRDDFKKAVDKNNTDISKTLKNFMIDYVIKHS